MSRTDTVIEGAGTIATEDPLGNAGEDEAAAAVARALGHPARVRIVRFLLSRPGCIGGDIVDEIGLAQSTVSEHLRILRDAGLVVGRIERPRICYSLAPAAAGPLLRLLEQVGAAGRDPAAGGAAAGPCYTPRRGGPRDAKEERQ